MHLSFADTDFMQRIQPTLPVTRPKTIHVEGVSQQAKWEVVNNQEGYTGVFTSGTDKVIVRYSVATPYKADADEISMVPAIAFKLFRDGIYSANTISMTTFKGTSSANFFESTFHNHIPKLDKPPFSILAAKFATATKYCFTLGLKDWADFDVSGNKSSNPEFPFMLSFVPQVSIPADTKGEYFNKVIARTLTQKGQTLFKVLATKSGADIRDSSYEPVHIANIISEGPAILSLYTDAKVMFSHNYMEKDVEVHPEWAEYIESCKPTKLPMVGASATSGKCPLGFGQ